MTSGVWVSEAAAIASLKPRPAASRGPKRLTMTALALAGLGVLAGCGGVPKERGVCPRVAILADAGKITKFPIVLVGREYWSGLLSWLKNTMLARANIGPAEFSLISVADDTDEVVEIIRKAHDGQGPGV